MPNSWFKFKQFTVQQDRCAMKVCTDACILGAWFADKTAAWSRVLDIGSGTGLLMLMLAQKHKGEIEGIELDLDAYRQLQENIGSSPWTSMLKAYPGDVRGFSFGEKFDFIISNPPFYEGQLPAADAASNLARHSSGLTLSELLAVIDANLTRDGAFGVVLPFQRSEEFAAMALSAHGFSLREKLLIRQTPGHDFFRSILYFSRLPERTATTSELTIHDDKGGYTEDFVRLMKDYYLYLA
ncbi:MAG TPA: methyltransferase [Puia sp.]|jgi:tRNA1Val (adenine37-N6)-methyltransferase|nr:methyltransferase [Puia sp.]